MQEFQKIAVIDNELQAGFVDAMLTDRNIAHLMVSYRDSAYDGVFQGGRGWGHVEASAEFREEILSILNDAKQREEREVEPTAPPASGRRIQSGSFWIGALVGAFVACLGCWVYANRHYNGVSKVRDEKGTVREWHYFSRGILTKAALDRNGDGRPDEFFDYESGKCVAQETDNDFDGIIDGRNTFSNGICVLSEWDANYDGKWDCEAVYADGVPNEVWRDTDFNGVYDETTAYDKGRPLRLEVRPNGTNITFRVETFQDGVRKSELIDEDMDGRLDVRKTFDSMGRVVSVTPL